MSNKTILWIGIVIAIPISYYLLTQRQRIDRENRPPMKGKPKPKL